MKNISVHLQQFVVESLHPKTLSGQRFSANEFEKWKSFIVNEIEKLSGQAFRSSLADPNRRESLITGIFTQVTELSNIINSYLVKFERVWRLHPQASGIKLSYTAVCGAFEGFLNDLARRYPEIADRIRFTDHTLKWVKVELKALLKKVSVNLFRQEIDPELTNVLTQGIVNLIDQRPLLRSHDSYLRKLMEELLTRTFAGTQELIDYLIINDFNLPEFFLFCVAKWSAKLIQLDGQLEQKEMLLEIKSHLFEVSVTKGLKFPMIEHRLYKELDHYVSEKYAIAKERFQITQQLIANDASKPRSKRMLINLSVAQLGLFIRLQVEKGILAKEHIGELFTFFARHFYTPNTDFISPESLQKKSSDVEHTTAKKLKAHLIEMLNWLNTNYNLSNYN